MTPLRTWTTTVPLAALVVLVVALVLGDPPDLLLALGALLLAGSVLAAVHHAEVVAHRVGEPFGSLVLAVAVTVIEVGLIVTLMTTGGKGVETLARDTVFAAVMITTNGIVGVSLLIAGFKHRLAYFNSEGSGAALATVVTLTTMTLVLPSFTRSAPDGEFSGGQLAFAACAALVLWILFVVTQTVRHRDFFLPVKRPDGGRPDDEHAEPPTTAVALRSFGLLVASLVAVVGLAKVESPVLESTVSTLGLPHAVVGVVIAMLVLLPEMLAASRNALRDRIQVSLNLGYGSAIASIGLTVPTIAIASLWLEPTLVLGLEPVHLVLLTLTAVVAVLTVVPGRATRLQGSIHLVILAAYLFLSAVP